MAMQVRCEMCGSLYDNAFKFCPECSQPNPRHPQNQQKPPKSASTATKETQAARSTARKKFTKIGESSLKVSEDTARQSSIQQLPEKKTKPDPMPEPEYEYDYEDDEDEVTSDDGSGYEEDDYEDDEQYPEDGYEEEEDYEDEYDEDEEEEDPESAERKIKSFRSKSKALSAPEAKKIRHSSKVPKKKVTPKKIASTTRSSLGKKKAYDPNHDGYYDDRLPAILDEVTKTSHVDVILKIALSIVVIAALITYCIFYVNV